VAGLTRHPAIDAEKTRQPLATTSADHYDHPTHGAGQARVPDRFFFWLGSGLARISGVAHVASNRPTGKITGLRIDPQR
jgi:hypothetical protein